MSHISDSKRIATNTLMLYVRMLLSMVVSLYSIEHQLSSGDCDQIEFILINDGSTDDT